MSPSPPEFEQEFAEFSVESALSDHKASPALLQEFNNRATALICHDNRVLFKHGEPVESVYLVRSGGVALALPVSLTRAIGFLAAPDSLVGLPAAFSGAPYSMTATGLGGTELAVMKRDKFCQMIAESSALSFDVLKILAAETRSARQAILESGAAFRKRDRAQ